MYNGQMDYGYRKLNQHSGSLILAFDVAFGCIVLWIDKELNQHT